MAAHLRLVALCVVFVAVMAVQAWSALALLSSQPVCASGELWESTTGAWTCSEVWT